MQKRIEISADIKNVKSQMRSLDNLFKSVEKTSPKIKLFDKDERNFLKNWAKEQIPLVRNEIKRLKDELKGIKDIDLLSATKASVVELEKTLNKMKRVGRGRGTITGGTVTQALERVPGLGGLVGAVGGGAAGMMLGGAAALGIRGYQAYGQRMGEVPGRLSLAGAMGAGQYQQQQGKLYEGQKYGFDVNEVLQQTNQLVREVGNIRELEQIQKVGRAYGIETGQLTGEAGVLRRMGGQQNVGKNFTDLIGSAVASNLDQSLIGEYLEATSQFIEQIATEGIPDVGELSRVMSGFVRQGGIFEDSRRTAARLSNFNDVIKNAEGARFGFYAQAFEKGLGKGMTGEKVLTALNQGLFGADTSRLSALSEKERKDIGLRGFGAEKRRRAISEQYEQMTQGLSTFGKAQVARQLTGVEDLGEALNLMRAYQKGGMSEKDLKKMEKEAKATPVEKAIFDLNKTLDAGFAQTNATSVNQSSILGEQIAPTVYAIKDTLLEMENDVLIPIAKKLGAITENVMGGRGGIGGAIGEIGASLINPFHMKRSVENKFAASQDLMTQANMSRDKETYKSLKKVYDDIGKTDITQYDIRNIQQAKQGATPAQLRRLGKEAGEKRLSLMMEEERMKKKGMAASPELAEQRQRVEGLIPSGVLPDKRVLEQYEKKAQLEGLTELQSAIQTMINAINKNSDETRRNTDKEVKFPAPRGAAASKPQARVVTHRGGVA